MGIGGGTGNSSAEDQTSAGLFGAFFDLIANNLISAMFTFCALYFVFSRFGDLILHQFELFMNPKTIQNRGDYTKFEASTPSALFPPATPGSRRAIRNFRRTPIHVNEDRTKRMV